MSHTYVVCSLLCATYGVSCIACAGSVRCASGIAFCIASSAYNELWLGAHMGITDLLTVEMPKAPPKPEKVHQLSHCTVDAALPVFKCQVL